MRDLDIDITCIALTTQTTIPPSTQSLQFLRGIGEQIWNQFVRFVDCQYPIDFHSMQHTPNSICMGNEFVINRRQSIIIINNSEDYEIMCRPPR